MSTKKAWKSYWRIPKPKPGVRRPQESQKQVTLSIALLKHGLLANEDIDSRMQSSCSVILPRVGSEGEERILMAHT